MMWEDVLEAIRERPIGRAGKSQYPLRFLLLIFIVATVSACSQDKQSNEKQLRDFLKTHPVANDPPVALMKRNAAGDAWLVTVQGYADNQTTCETLIEPYNNDPSLSTFAGTYYCDPIN